MWSHMDIIWSNAIVLGITPTTIKNGFCCLYSFCHYSAPGQAIFKNYMRYGKIFCPLQYTSENQIHFGALFKKKSIFTSQKFRLVFTALFHSKKQINYSTYRE